MLKVESMLLPALLYFGDLPTDWSLWRRMEAIFVKLVSVVYLTVVVPGTGNASQ